MKLRKLFATIAVALIGAITLASCSTNKSGITEKNVVIETVSKTSKSIKLSFTFDKNDNLDSGNASLHVKQYKYEEATETYDKDLSLTLDSSTRKGVLDFTGLTATTNYRFKLYVTYAGSDSLITTYDEKTKASSQTKEDAVHITTKEEFEKIVDDPSAYYILDEDITFGTTTDDETTNSTLPSMFSSTTQFKGTFDGNGHTISYYNIVAAEYTGLFAYASGATIKNLTVKNAKADFTSARGNTKAGLIVGYAERTLIENCKVVDGSMLYTASGSAETYLGLVAGRIVNSSIINTTVENGSINVNQAKIKISAGLLAGSMEDNGLVTVDGANVAVDNTNVAGTIKVVTYYNTSSTGYIAIGGFIGNCNTSGLIQKSSSDVDIVISKQSVSSTDEYNLYVGGFIGANSLSVFNVTKCLAVSKISVYAGEYKLNDDGTVVDVDYTKNKMTKGKVTNSSGEVTGTYYTYLGGFVGRILGTINKISDSYALLKDEIYFNGMLDDAVVVDKTIDASTEEGKAKVKIVNTQTGDSTITFALAKHGEEVFYSTGDLIDLNTELDVKVTNNSSKTLLLSIIVGDVVREVELQPKESFDEVVTLTDNAVFALEQKVTVVNYLYKNDFAGSYGDALAKVTNCHTNLDESENEISEALYEIFKAVVDKYRN